MLMYLTMSPKRLLPRTVNSMNYSNDSAFPSAMPRAETKGTLIGPQAERRRSYVNLIERVRRAKQTLASQAFVSHFILANAVVRPYGVLESTGEAYTVVHLGQTLTDTDPIANGEHQVKFVAAPKHTVRQHQDAAW